MKPQLNKRKNLETTLKHKQNLKRFTDKTLAHTYVTGTSCLEISEISTCNILAPKPRSC